MSFLIQKLCKGKREGVAVPGLLLGRPSNEIPDK